MTSPSRPERINAELHAVQTLTTYLHLLAERHRTIDPLAAGIAAIADMIGAKAPMAPHLLPILRSDLFNGLAPAIF